MSIRVAAVQFAPVFRNVAANVQRMTTLTLEAARGGAQLIVLPELATSGYSMMSPAEALPMAEEVSTVAASGLSGSVGVMSRLAKGLGVTIVWGLVERDPGTGSLYNAQAYVDPTGYLMSYRKVNRWANDILWAQEGRANPPVHKSASFKTTDGARAVRKVGLLICRDVRDKVNDNWKSFYEPGDADVVCLSSNWGDGGFPSLSWWDFARDNKTTLIVSNRYGKEANNDFGEGGICVISPDGKVQCEGLVWDQDCIVYADVP